MSLTEEYINIVCADCKYKSEPFKKLTLEQMDRIDHNRTELVFKKGELVSKQGAFMSHIIYIRKGFVKLYLENDDDITILSIAKPGSFIGIQALYGEAIFPFSAEALTNTEVCLKDINVFRSLVIDNSAFAKGIIEILNDDLLKSYNRLFSLTNKQINGRFSELLLFMRNVLYKANPFHLSISRKDMADLISTSPESVSRLMSEFKDQGIIKVQGHTVEILDDIRLDTICKCG
jgi:CRP/FNR family transcriptional regulator, polysaccharide utilization system transcription regulator